MSGKSNDIVLNILGGIADAAVAPVKAAAEVISDGDVSDETASALIKGMTNDYVSDALIDTDTSDSKK